MGANPNPTNAPHTAANKKAPRPKPGRSKRFLKRESGFDRRRNRRRLRPARSCHFANLEPREPLDADVFAKLRHGASHHLANRGALVLDIVLFVEAVVLVEFFHLTS